MKNLIASLIILISFAFLACENSGSGVDDNPDIKPKPQENSKINDYLKGKGNTNKSETGTSNKYWVDINNPLASDENAGTEDKPWKSFTHAVKMADTGDTVYVMPGVYVDSTEQNNPNSMWTNFFPANSGEEGNPITFKSVVPKKAILKSKNESSELATRDKALAFHSRTDIVFDGFKAIGMVQFTGCERINFINGEVTLGSIAWDDPSLLWGIVIERSSHCVIRNNYIHSMGAVYKDDKKYLKHNQAGIMLFGGKIENICQNNLVEYNYLDMSNNVYSGLGNKAGNLNSNVWRNNFVTRAVAGVFSIGSTDTTRKVYNSYYYNNILTENNYGIVFENNTKSPTIANNTIVNSKISAFKIGVLNSSDILFVNNIIANTPSFLKVEAYYGSEVDNFWEVFDISDYNQFFNITKVFAEKEASPKLRLEKFSDFQAKELEINGLEGDPEFNDILGTKPEDFKRKVYPEDGAGTKEEFNFMKLRGAYSSNDDIIGSF